MNEDRLVAKPGHAPDTLEPDLAWMAEAYCREWHPEDWFDDHTSPKQARALCGPCPVQNDCLLYALKTDSRFGVWGGLTETERDGLHRRWNGNVA